MLCVGAFTCWPWSSAPAGHSPLISYYPTKRDEFRRTGTVGQLILGFPWVLGHLSLDIYACTHLLRQPFPGFFFSPDVKERPAPISSRGRLPKAVSLTPIQSRGPFLSHRITRSLACTNPDSDSGSNAPTTDSRHYNPPFSNAQIFPLQKPTPGAQPSVESLDAGGLPWHWLCKTVLQPAVRESLKPPMAKNSPLPFLVFV